MFCIFYWFLVFFLPNIRQQFEKSESLCATVSLDADVSAILHILEIAVSSWGSLVRLELTVSISDSPWVIGH